MKIAVWDTYVSRENDLTMHFDILVPEGLKDEAKIFGFGNEYLNRKPFKTGSLQAKECSFCHIEEASVEVQNEINNKGYYILEMENCH